MGEPELATIFKIFLSSENIHLNINLETVLKKEILRKLSRVTPRHSVLLLSVHPGEKTQIHTKASCATVHRSSVYNTKRHKQPKCLSVDKWVNKRCYTHTTGYYSASKGNEILTHAKIETLQILC